MRREETQKLSLDKETLELILSQLKTERIGEGISADEVRKIIETELEAFAADRINASDHALASGGASIVGSKTSRSYRTGLMNWLSGASTHPPSIILVVS